MQFPGHTQGAVLGTVVHKDKLKIRAVTFFHFGSHAGCLLVEQGHGFLFIVTGHNEGDQHRGKPPFG